MIPLRFRGVCMATLCVLLAGCNATPGLLQEPKPTDPNDGYEGILPKAGIDTTMDWGPKQTYLLRDFEDLRKNFAKLQTSYDDLNVEKQNLLTQLANGNTAFEREKAQRLQAEAEVALLRDRRRELEARILSLSIEKAQLEQSTLLAKIEALQATIDAGAGGAVEASANGLGRR